MILASASPRRRELLTQIGVLFTVDPADIDESLLVDEAPGAYVERMAREKAGVVAARHPGETVLGSDTTVVCDGEILAKPADTEDAVRMLKALSGRSHQVLTGVAVACDAEVRSQVVTTEVRFRELAEDEITAYVATGEPLDKAGGYGIQGFGAVFVADMKGSYSNVVGLPLTETAALLQQSDIPLWQLGN